MEILHEEKKWMDDVTALFWAVHAKDSLQMFSGLSPCQQLFVQRFPDILKGPL